MLGFGLLVSRLAIMAENNLQSVAFPTLDEAQNAELARCTAASPKRFEDGQRLFTVGDRDFKFFIVKTGAIDIVDCSGDKPTTLTTHRPGQFSGDVTHRGGSNTQFNTGSKFNVPLQSYDLVNLRAGLEWRSWEFTVFMKNALDRRAEIDAISSDQDPLARITARPRTGGLSVNYKF